MMNKSTVSSIIREKDIQNQVVVFTVSCNMNFCDNKCDDHIVVTVDFFLNSLHPVQTSDVVRLRIKN